MALPLHYKILASLHKKFARGISNIGFNKFLYALALKGIGVDNYENNEVSGENYLLKRILSKKVKPVLIDVGGFHGEYSADALAVNPSTISYLFEPNPSNFAVSVNNLKSTSVNCLNLAVGAEKSVLSFYDRKQDSGSQHGTLVKGVIDQLHHSEVIELSVEVITLDDFITEYGIHRIDLLKIDTEGYEYPVLLGAKKALGAGIIECIQFEFNEMNVMSRVYLKDFIELLPNFNLYRLMEDGLMPIASYHPLHHEIFGFQNIVAIKKS